MFRRWPHTGREPLRTRKRRYNQVLRSGGATENVGDASEQNIKEEKGNEGGGWGGYV